MSINKIRYRFTSTRTRDLFSRYKSTPKDNDSQESIAKQTAIAIFELPVFWQLSALGRILRFFRLVIQFVVNCCARFLDLLSLNSYSLNHLFSQIHDTKPKIWTKVFLRYLYCNTAIFIPPFFGSQGNISVDQTTKLSHICTHMTWCGRVIWLNYSHFFVRLYECDGPGHTVSWKQPAVLNFRFLPYEHSDGTRRTGQVTNMAIQHLITVWLFTKHDRCFLQVTSKCTRGT
jgi:hypothetical protein